MGLAFWPVNLRPHYDMGPHLASRLGSLPHLPWPSFNADGAASSAGAAQAALLVNGPSDDAPLVGPEVLAIAAAVLVGCWAAWAALIGCWSDADWPLGDEDNRSTASNRRSETDGGSSGNSDSRSSNWIRSNQTGGDEKLVQHASETEVVFQEANSRAEAAEAAAIVRGQLAFLVHWLGFWLPVCGGVQHGMVLH